MFDTIWDVEVVEVIKRVEYPPDVKIMALVAVVVVTD
jgi:hypothetical protein